jgi:hypothetical protein
MIEVNGREISDEEDRLAQDRLNYQAVENQEKMSEIMFRELGKLMKKQIQDREVRAWRYLLECSEMTPVNEVIKEICHENLVCNSDMLFNPNFNPGRVTYPSLHNRI